MTEQHAADTDYDQQYMPHGNGEYHHELPLADIPATIKLSEPTPRPRSWPLSARLTVAVAVLVTAATLAITMVTISSMAARQARTETRVSELYGVVGLNATQSSQANSKTGGSVASLQSQLGAVEAQLAALARRVSHHGLCFSFSRDTGSGALVNVNLTTPSASAGSYTCGQGTFVSVVPAP